MPALWLRITQSSSMRPFSPTTVFKNLAARSQRPRSPMLSPKEDCGCPEIDPKDPRIRRKVKVKSKSKERKSKPSAKSGDVDFDEDAQAEPDEPDAQDADQDEDPEAYLVEAQTSEESEMDSDGMLDWSASECKDYKDRINCDRCMRLSSRLFNQAK